MSPDPEFEKKNQDSKQDSIQDSTQDKVENNFESKTLRLSMEERGGKQDLPKSLTENLEKITK